jgi:hypothetical protein
MAHVTYLLGAGASIKALPDNKNLLNRLSQLVETGSKLGIELDYLKAFQNIYQPLIKEAQDEISLDTLARVYINNPDKLHQIKVLIWLFFSSQAGKKSLDPRYKQLLLKIREDNTNDFFIRRNFSFLSWNYDLQLEEAFSVLAQTELWRVPISLYSFPGFHFINPDALAKNSNSELFQLIHLNGCGGYYYDNEKSSYSNWYNCDFTNKKDYEEMLNIIMHKFHTNDFKKNALLNCINFAGERTPINDKKKFYVSVVAKETTHLVIIGYSFPDFNRQMDKSIIDQMEKLEYIYIQDPEADEIENKIKLTYPSLVNKINNGGLRIHKDKKCEEFHYPYNID